MSALSTALLAAIATAPTAQLQAVADWRMDRLHTDSETDFMLAVLRELGRRSRQVRAHSECAEVANG